MTDFFTADLHFGHNNVINFKNTDGTKARDFATVQDMEDAMVQMHNEIVKPTDKVYMLGDIAFNQRGLDKVKQMNGIKILVKGNHDQLKLNKYVDVFKDVRGCHVMNGLVFTHIPIHIDQLGRFGCNVHGHLHMNRVMQGDKIDPRFLCVSVEHTALKPIEFEDMVERIVAQGGKLGMVQGNGPTPKKDQSAQNALFNSH
jgi:calcineurin-like phosphoesterase family protein|tara:strand:+ start:1254 stop:1853 length:600 start_codon:yes stop_codon:yes gene_type:complete